MMWIVWDVRHVSVAVMINTTQVHNCMPPTVKNCVQCAHCVFNLNSSPGDDVVKLMQQFPNIQFVCSWPSEHPLTVFHIFFTEYKQLQENQCLCKVVKSLFVLLNATNSWQSSVQNNTCDSMNRHKYSLLCTCAFCKGTTTVRSLAEPPRFTYKQQSSPLRLYKIIYIRPHNMYLKVLNSILKW